MRSATLLLLSAVCAALTFTRAGTAQQPTSQPRTPAAETKPVPIPVPAKPTPQQGKGKEPPSSKEVRIRAEIQRMRRKMRDGALLNSHVRVTVRLNNGNRIRGIVKNGRLVEKLDGLRFVEAERGTKGAGIRIYYFDASGSYIFLPFESIRRYDVGERLSTEQLAEIEAKVKAGNQKAQEKWQQLKAGRQTAKAGKQAAQGAEAEIKAEQAKQAAAAKETKEQKRLLALVAEFLPEDGWSAARKAEIERRKVVVGAFPNETEKRFLLVFADWQKGVALKAQLEAAEEANAGTGGSEAKPTDPQPTPAPTVDPSPAPPVPTPATPAGGTPAPTNPVPPAPIPPATRPG